jgi:hypothetical protein
MITNLAKGLHIRFKILRRFNKSLLRRIWHQLLGEMITGMLCKCCWRTFCKGVGVVYLHKPRRGIPYGYTPGFRQAFPLFLPFVMQQAQFALPGQMPASQGR